MLSGLRVIKSSILKIHKLITYTDKRKQSFAHFNVTVLKVTHERRQVVLSGSYTDCAPR